MKFTATDVTEITAAVLLCEFAGFLGSIFTTPSIPVWYIFLRKPIATPPNELFAPVWLILYALMGVSLFLLWRKRTIKDPQPAASTFFSIQLFLNILWSIVFFTFHWPLGGFIVAIFLWLSVYFTVMTLFKISWPASLFLLPYLIWVSYAVYLNAGIWWLN